MSASDVLPFCDFDTMTFPECFAFIERSRREINLMLETPKASDEDRQELASIYMALNRLESRVLANSGGAKPY